jgi:hypothetical protein
MDNYQKSEQQIKIEAEYAERVKGQLFKAGTYTDSITGLPTPQYKMNSGRPSEPTLRMPKK